MPRIQVFAILLAGAGLLPSAGCGGSVEVEASPTAFARVPAEAAELRAAAPAPGLPTPVEVEADGAAGEGPGAGALVIAPPASAALAASVSYTLDLDGDGVPDKVQLVSNGTVYQVTAIDGTGAGSLPMPNIGLNPARVLIASQVINQWKPQRLLFVYADHVQMLLLDWPNGSVKAVRDTWSIGTGWQHASVHTLHPCFTTAPNISWASQSLVMRYANRAVVWDVFTGFTATEIPRKAVVQVTGADLELVQYTAGSACSGAEFGIFTFKTTTQVGTTRRVHRDLRFVGNGVESATGALVIGNLPSPPDEVTTIPTTPFVGNDYNGDGVADKIFNFNAAMTQLTVIHNPKGGVAVPDSTYALFPGQSVFVQRYDHAEMDGIPGEEIVVVGVVASGVDQGKTAIQVINDTQKKVAVSYERFDRVEKWVLQPLQGTIGTNPGAKQMVFSRTGQMGYTAMAWIVRGTLNFATSIVTFDSGLVSRGDIDLLFDDVDGSGAAEMIFLKRPLSGDGTAVFYSGHNKTSHQVTFPPYADKFKIDGSITGYPCLVLGYTNGVPTSAGEPYTPSADGRYHRLFWDDKAGKWYLLPDLGAF